MVITLRPFVACIVLLIIGCDSGISDKNLSFILPRDAAILMQEDRSTLLGQRASTVVVDSRPTWSYRKSHISESINIPFGRLHLLAWRLEHAGIIIVSGETYNDSVSIAMSKELMTMGFKDVKTLRGGLVGWAEADESIETAE